MNESTKALGRLPQGERNRTEAAYERFLQEQQMVGLILWFQFEGMKFRLADKTFYTPDFIVQTNSGHLEAHEVKGFWQDDARVKIKVAADRFKPFKFIAAKPRAKKDGGGWQIEEF